MGPFIVFEGVEGSGKSTQSESLKRRLIREGYAVTLVREPGGTAIAECIRGWLKSDLEIPTLTELFLFLAARASLIDSVIRPTLERGEVVVCDRYHYSTISYQGLGRGLDIDMIRRLSEFATGGLLPDLAVLLDLPPAEGLARKAGGDSDRFEEQERDFHERVRQGYLGQTLQDPDRWLVLDSSEPRNTLADAVWNRVIRLPLSNNARTFL